MILQHNSELWRLSEKLLNWNLHISRKEKLWKWNCSHRKLWLSWESYNNIFARFAQKKEAAEMLLTSRRLCKAEDLYWLLLLPMNCNCILYMNCTALMTKLNCIWLYWGNFKTILDSVGCIVLLTPLSLSMPAPDSARTFSWLFLAKFNSEQGLLQLSDLACTLSLLQGGSSWGNFNYCRAGGTEPMVL